jgi:hypothetical protein
MTLRASWQSGRKAPVKPTAINIVVKIKHRKYSQVRDQHELFNSIN